MAGLGQVSIAATVQNLLTGSKSLGPVVANVASAVAQTTQTDFAIGDNTITIPTGTTWLIIVMPPAATGVIKLKGNAGDTGIQVSKTAPALVLPFDGTLPTLIINATVAITGVELLFI